MARARADLRHCLPSAMLVIERCSYQLSYCKSFLRHEPHCSPRTSCMCIRPPDMALQVLEHLQSEKGLEEIKTRLAP